MKKSKYIYILFGLIFFTACTPKYGEDALEAEEDYIRPCSSVSSYYYSTTDYDQVISISRGELEPGYNGLEPLSKITEIPSDDTIAPLNARYRYKATLDDGYYNSNDKYDFYLYFAKMPEHGLSTVYTADTIHSIDDVVLKMYKRERYYSYNENAYITFIDTINMNGTKTMSTNKKYNRTYIGMCPIETDYNSSSNDVEFAIMFNDNE